MNNANIKTYKVKRFAHYRDGWWKETEAAKVAVFPWPAVNDYRPLTCAWLGTDGTSLFVYMETNETNLRAETREFGHVHTDSCMEFFFSPEPASSPQYLNFELNSIGGMYLAIGTERHVRTKLPEENYRELFKVKTAVHEKGWNLEYRVPLSFLKKFFTSLELKPGHLMRGNFYKCGDNTARPHFGCWSPIDLPKPDFHCPEFFGNLILD